MNLFLLSLCVNTLAYLHCDKHIVKMCLETTQMLYTAHHVLESKVLENAPKTKQGGIYRKTHQNHPVTMWIRECYANYVFACKVGIALCDEYQRRYEKEHSVKKHLLWLSDNVPKNIEPKGEMTLFPQAMPEEYKCKFPLNNKDIVKSYIRYYIFEKLKFAKWRFVDDRGDPSKKLCINNLTVKELRDVATNKGLIQVSSKKYIRKSELIEILTK